MANNQRPSSSTSRIPLIISTPSSNMPSRASYSSPSNRSKIHLPHPKVLPFPDIPATPKSLVSSTNPSPQPTRSNSSTGLHEARLSVDMARSGSSDSGDALGRSSGSGHSRRRTSTPPISSPLSGSVSPPPVIVAGPSRSRALTSPNPRPILSPIPSTPSTRRLDVFSDLMATSEPSQSPGPSRQSTFTPTKPPPTEEEPIKPVPPEPIKKASLPSTSMPATIQIMPSGPSKVISEHIYSSFLNGECADIRIWVSKWGIGWKVHKMVLVQAGFFHSLFLGGFSEMTARSSKGKDKALFDDDWAGEKIELTFDDPNITRVAFEIALSRLYSPFPHLHVPSIILPTPSSPLTPSYGSSHKSTNLESMHTTTAKNTHLATPRLLLSLLATAIYLGQTSLMREVLAIVLRTIGPTTIGRYLGFALGEGVGPEEWTGQDAAPARGLEHVGQQLPQSMSAPEAEAPVSSDEEGKVGESPRSNPGSPSTSSTPTVRSTLGFSSLRRQNDSLSLSEADFALPHYYGFPSDKIGEACGCWLARWGVEVLDIEATLPPNHPTRLWRHRGLPAAFIRAVLSSDSFFVKDEIERYRVARRVLDLRRAGWEGEMEVKGDLSVGSSQDGCEEWDEDEAELEKVFAEGIYYTHVSFESLSLIAQDIDPNTAMPYAPLAVLQSAHWSAADLRSRITSASSGELDPHHLGLSQSTSELVSATQSKRRFAPRSRISSGYSETSTTSIAPLSKIYHPVPIDELHRAGAGGLVFSINSSSSIPGLPDLGPESDTFPGGSVRRSRPPPQGEHTLFGLQNGSRTLSFLQSHHSLNIAAQSLGAEQRETSWTTNEPFRFSAEFWGIDKLVEKQRAYSPTFFYAGSWFNVYVQPNQKKDKGTQLGIYLQRQNPRDPEGIPAASAPPRPAQPGSDRGARGDRSDSTALLESSLAARFGLNTSPPLTPPGRPGFSRHMSIPALSVGSPVRPSGALPGVDSREEAQGPYEDNRKAVKAYFSISCASALGTTLIRFCSAPDSFTLSQSWGWKSSALRSEEYISSMGSEPSDRERLEDGVLGWTGSVASSGATLGSDASTSGAEGSLRVTVVVGLV